VLRVDDDGPRLLVILVSDWCAVGKHAGLRLLGHTLLRLFREVVDVVLRHQHLDAVDELLVRPALSAEHLALFDKVDLEVKVVQR
jgi:hypothetical protein